MKLTTPIAPPEQRMRKEHRYIAAQLVMPGLFGLLLASIMLAVSFGSTAISLGTIVQILLNGTGLFHFVRQWDPADELIILQVRMPLVMGDALVGASLAVAGTLFQGMLRNPLADPFLIGTSSGAALGAAIAFVLPFDTLYGSFFPLTPVLAFVGALISVLFVYMIARTDGRTPVITLLLAGVVLNAVMTAFQTLILTIFPRSQFSIQALFNWLYGGVVVTGWAPVVLIAGLAFVGILCAFGLSGVLDVFALGEESAAYLGLNVERLKFIIVIVASLLTAAAVSISGLIGFIGLVTPHVMRLLLGPGHRLLILSSALGGAVFLILADLLARIIIAPATLPVGVFTALIGAPFFLILLRNSKRDYKW